MPIYEYVCSKCKRSFELLLKNASEKAVCPKCGAADPKKQFSTFSSVSAGGGFECGDSGCDPDSCGGSCAASGSCPYND